LVLYGGSGRLLDASRWQLDLLRQRWLNRRVEDVSESQRREVRAAHREAHKLYRGGDVDGPLVFVRSEEWSRLPDKAWHLEWSELTSGGVDVVVVAGAHSALLHAVNVGELGSAISSALGSG
jgi:thioesterase domain-containing protein